MIIPMMQLGVCSTIGGFMIGGEPTVADNAVRLFVKNGVIGKEGNFAAAARFARAFGAGLPDPLTDKISRFFVTAHELICDGVEKPPKSLVSAYDAFRASPSSAGIALYFGRLSELLEEAHRSRKP